MLQRNDTGDTRIFPTLMPPLEVAAGEVVDYPVRLDLLTPVGSRERVLGEGEAEAAEAAEPAAEAVVKDEPVARKATKAAGSR